MEKRDRGTRAACGTALIALGVATLVGVACCAAALKALERTAAETERDPLGTTGHDAGAQNDAGRAGTGANIDWDYWQSVNPDVVAWICVPGTEVDTPVVLAPADDPQHYLTHDVLGNWNPCGCPYVDAACQEGIDSSNVVIYGHNMGDGALFGELVEYRDATWAASHPRIDVLTPGGKRHLTVRGARTLAGSSESKRVAFQDGADLAQYAKDSLEACDTTVGEASAPFKRMYTICTCSYFVTPTDERTLVFAFEQ